MGQVEIMMNEWLRHRRVLEVLLQGIGDNDINFRPWEKAMTLRELPIHIAYWSDVFVNMVKNGDANFPSLMKAEPEATDLKSMKEVRQAVRDWTERTKENYAA